MSVFIVIHPVNALFKMAVYHKRRVATILNFLILLVLSSRASHLILAEKSSLALKWQNLKVEASLFLTFYVMK